MHLYLSKFLEKVGVKDLKDLSKEEKEVFDKWSKILSEEKELTLNDLKDFCENQVKIIEAKWRNYDKKNEEKAELIPYHTVYKTLLEAINSPRSSREALEKYLNQLIS